MSENKIHVFERAGLGKAPFRFVGITEERGPKVVERANGVTFSVGAPGQPMGSCNFCGTGIAECCHIVSADGKRFIVGNECVKRTGDKGLAKVTNEAINKIRRAARHKREALKIEQAGAWLQKPDVRLCLENRKHPFGFKDRDGNPLTALEWAEWMMDNAGNAGKVKVYKFILATVPGILEVK